MKNVIFLEDQPEKLKPVINDIKTNFAEVLNADTVLYYCKDALQVNEDEDEKIKDNLEIDTLKRVDFWNLDAVLDELYENQDNIFIFDTQLDQKRWDDFEYMINVNYALGKKKDGRIWFYTVAGPYYKDNIVNHFEDYVLEAKVQKEGEVLLKLSENVPFMNALYTE